MWPIRRRSDKFGGAWTRGSRIARRNVNTPGVASRRAWRLQSRRGKWPRMCEEDDGYRFISMMWADNYWIFSDNRERLMCMVNDIIDELMDLDMEPKLESLW